MVVRVATPFKKQRAVQEAGASHQRNALGCSPWLGLGPAPHLPAPCPSYPHSFLPPHTLPFLPPCSIRHARLGVPLGQTLFGKTVLVVGFGNIAKELAIRCAWSPPILWQAGCSASFRSVSWPTWRSHIAPSGARTPQPKTSLPLPCCKCTALRLCCRLKPFGVRITALRRKPWGGPHTGGAAAEQQPRSTCSGQQEGQQPGEGMQVDDDQPPREQQMEEDGEQQTAQQAQQTVQQAQQAAVQDVQQPAARLHQAHDPELDAAAEAALADKGCWPADCSRLAGEADIIAREWGASCGSWAGCSHA